MCPGASRLFGFFLFASGLTASAAPPGSALRQLREIPDASRATLRVRTADRGLYPIPAYLTGKFAEHLGANIYNGMDAQIVRNPTFADYPFWSGQMTPDGVTRFQIDDVKINQELRRQATRQGWPESALDGLVAARADGLACFWTRIGTRESVQVSPDAGPNGGRAQRVQVRAAGEGLAQWAYLPLHRARRYEFEIYARSPDITSLTVALAPRGTTPNFTRALPSAATATIEGLSAGWQKLSGTLEIEPGSPADVPYQLSLTANGPGQFVIQRCLLRPADHVNGADPDVIRLLKESRLPLLRWPGGNFASTYHWEDAVGPVEQRPTRPNYAWGNLEPNLFGTDEFIAFCRAVGCEPMICLNAGSGTPDEAARWIEYCNGPATSPMGARRAANGHPEPYRVKHWEVGNELWGRWQFHWTTPEGYVDRYQQFLQKMFAADPGIKPYACGAPVLWGKHWNDTLVAGAAPLLESITDHPLIGGSVPPTADPLDVYRDFMAVPGVLEQKWSDLERDMARGGVKQPRLAVTELQMFARIGGAADASAAGRLTHDNLVNPGTMAEGLYDVLIYHAAVRLQPFVEMVTHSAIVNHGGGLRKERERVYANPCFYAQAAFAAFAGATPVAVDLDTAVEHAPRVLPDLKNAAPSARFGAIDALAALATDGSLLLSIVHRGTAGPVRLSVALQDFRSGDAAALRTLTADVPWAANSLDAPRAITPVDSAIDVKNGRLELDLRPYTVVRLRIPARR
ncbi:MAG: alpha-L-arabinofuranosidase C-terminal domain-containing protein [Limisphaerales bacterium]